MLEGPRSLSRKDGLARTLPERRLSTSASPWLLLFVPKLLFFNELKTILFRSFCS